MAGSSGIGTELDNHVFKKMTAFIYSDDAFLNVHFLIGNSREVVKANSSILASLSDVFRTMLLSEHWAPADGIQRLGKRAHLGHEKCRAEDRMNENGIREIDIKHTDPTHFRAFVELAHAQQLHLDIDTAFGTLGVAHKYNVPEIVQHCLRVLGRYLTRGNVLEIFDKALITRLEEVVDLCLPHICEHATELITSPQFLDLSQESILRIYKEDGLRADEYSLYKSLCAWAQCEFDRKVPDDFGKTDRKLVLQLMVGSTSLKFCIRPTLISRREFVNFVCGDNIFTDEEEIAILKHPHQPLSLIPYATKERTGTSASHSSTIALHGVGPRRLGELMMVGQFEEPITDTIRFRYNRDVYLQGLTFLGSTNDDEPSYDVQIILSWGESNSDMPHVGYYRDVASPGGRGKNFYVKLSDAELLQAEVWYELTFIVDGPSCFYQKTFAKQTIYNGSPFVQPIICECDGDVCWSQLDEMKIVPA